MYIASHSIKSQIEICGNKNICAHLNTKYYSSFKHCNSGRHSNFNWQRVPNTWSTRRERSIPINLAALFWTLWSLSSLVFYLSAFLVLLSLSCDIAAQINSLEGQPFYAPTQAICCSKSLLLSNHCSRGRAGPEPAGRARRGSFQGRTQTWPTSGPRCGGQSGTPPRCLWAEGQGRIWSQNLHF